MDRRARTSAGPCGSVHRPIRAVSQLLWPDKDREEWFSLEENHEKGLRSPGFPAVRHSPRAIMCGFLHGKPHAVRWSTKLHRKSGFGLHQLRNRYSPEVSFERLKGDRTGCGKSREGDGNEPLSGFYETAVLVKVFFCFSFVAFLVFVFAVAVCWFQDSSRASIRTLDEPLAARCLLGSDVDELGLLSKARPLGPSR
jgi:hypothetical protein